MEACTKALDFALYSSNHYHLPHQPPDEADDFMF